MPKTLVVVAAHADDAELNAGGVMLQWAAQGHKIHIIMVTNNCSGPCIPDGGEPSQARRLLPHETTAVRHREQDAAAAFSGATMHYLMYNQRHYWGGQKEIDVDYVHDDPIAESVKGRPQVLIVCNKAEYIDKMADLLAGLKPDLVLTHTSLDVDPEHHAVAALVWQAMNKRDELKSVPLRFWTPSTMSPDGMIETPYDVIEDISDVHQAKMDLCACHASQMTPRRWSIIKQRAAYWGKKIGKAYGEPYVTAKRQGETT